MGKKKSSTKKQPVKKTDLKSAEHGSAAGQADESVGLNGSVVVPESADQEQDQDNDEEVEVNDEEAEDNESEAKDSENKDLEHVNELEDKEPEHVNQSEQVNELEQDNNSEHDKDSEHANQSEDNQSEHDKDSEHVNQSEDNQSEEEDEETLSKDEMIARLTEERDAIQDQYDDLLDKISGMKSLFQDMKQSKQELVTAKAQLEEYSSQNLLLRDKVSSFKIENESITSKLSAKETTIKDLTAKTQSLEKKLSSAQIEYTKNQDFNEREMEAMKIIRKDLNEKVDNLQLLLNNTNKDITLFKNEISELKESILQHEETEQFLASKLEALESEKIDLSKDMEQNIATFEDQKRELEAKIASLESEKDEQAKLIETLGSEKSAHEATEAKVSDLENQLTVKFNEVSELKAENIKLSQHLQNSLQLLKKATSSEQIDKELISNLIVTFVSIPRGESRKYEVLELISSFLDWDDFRKKEAGLIYNKDALKNNNLQRKESLLSEDGIVGKWTEFLEKESEK